MSSDKKKSAFLFAFLSFPCFSFPLNPNFVFVSTHTQPTFVECQSSKNHLQNKETKLQQILHKFYVKCESLFSFYPNASSDSPSIITKKGNMIFLFNEKNRLEPLGFLLSPQNENLIGMSRKVEDGKFLLGFQNKAREPVAFIQDSHGVVYSVTRLPKQRYSIQSMGILASVAKN